MRDTEDIGDANDDEDGLDEISPSPIVVGGEFWDVDLGESRSSRGSRKEPKEKDKEEPETFTSEMTE